MIQTAQKEVVERRKEVRFSVKLLGRYMLPDRREFPCTITEVAIDSIALSGSEQGKPGDEVIVYGDRLGRIEGKISRHVEGGFVIELVLTAAGRNKLAERLCEIEGNDETQTDEKRKHLRIPSDETQSRFILPDGRSYKCEVLDVSVSGAAIRVEVCPAIGTMVQLGKMHGKVVRHIENGVAIEFRQGRDTGALAENFTDIATA